LAINKSKGRENKIKLSIKNIMGKIILIVVIIMLLGIGGYFISKNKTPAGTSSQNSNSQQPTSSGQNQVPQNQTQSVAISNFAFVPDSVTVKAGTTVRWTNGDSATHKIQSNTSAFGSGNLAQGDSYEFQFNVAGTYDYICAIHTYMKGKIIVSQ